MSYSTAFATALVGWVLGASGYIESTAGETIIQSENVILAIRLLLGVTITVLFTLGFIVSLKYKITDRKLERIRYFSDKKRDGTFDMISDEEKQEYQELQKELC